MTDLPERPAPARAENEPTTPGGPEPVGENGPDEAAAEEALQAEAEAVGRELFQLEEPRLTRLAGGRVNDTFLVESRGERFVLQRLNDFFQGDEALGLNWLWIRQRLEDADRPAEPPLPPIYPDREGRYLSGLPGGERRWRLTGFVDGRALPPAPAPAREAARLLGRLHHHLNRPAPLELKPPPEGEFTNQRLNRPDDFTVLLEYYRGHPHLPAVEPLILEAAEAAAQLPFYPAFTNIFNLHDVVIHGDPKAGNFLFSPEGRALSLLDWDTAGYGHVLIDLAEMLRSWGASGDPERPLTEDGPVAVLEGYARTGLPLEDEELEFLAPALRAVALNLSRRYLTDALAEVYFRWDRSRYPSLYRQNLDRAASMLSMADYLLDHEIPLTELLKAAYARGRELRELPY